MKNNNNKRKPPKNPDPLSNANTMAREGMNIIRNIAYGKFNINENGHLFRDLDFVKATIAEVDKRLMTSGIHITAIQYAYAGTNDPNVLNVLLRDQKTYEAYTLIRQELSRIVMSNGDIGFLVTLANKLPKYKYNI